MSWITIDTTKVRLTPGEIARINNAIDKTTSLEEVAAQVTDEVRGYVGRRVPLGDAGTIPSELHDAALTMVAFRYLSNIPSVSLITEARKDAYEDALRLLKDASRGDFVVVGPPSPAPDQPTVPSPRIKPREKRYWPE